MRFWRHGLRLLSGLRRSDDGEMAVVNAVNAALDFYAANGGAASADAAA